MAKTRTLQIAPITLPCPYCKAGPGHDCSTTPGGFAALHIQRIKAAAAKDEANKRKRKDFTRREGDSTY